MFKPSLQFIWFVLISFSVMACRTAPAAPPPANPTATPLAEMATPTSPSQPDTPSPLSTSPLAPTTPAETPAPEPTATGPTSSAADEETAGKANADVVFVKAALEDGDTWTFHVTVAHPDTGWEDYADGWDVVLPDGTVVKPNPDDPFTRLLLHPHETEQPFTRSQSNIEIPPDVTVVTVRAHDLVAGWGGQEIMVDLTQAEGSGFEVVR